MIKFYLLTNNKTRRNLGHQIIGMRIQTEHERIKIINNFGLYFSLRSDYSFYNN